MWSQNSWKGVDCFLTSSNKVTYSSLLSGNCCHAEDDGWSIWLWRYSLTQPITRATFAEMVPSFVADSFLSRAADRRGLVRDLVDLGLRINKSVGGS